MTIESRIALSAHKQAVRYWVNETMKWRAIGLSASIVCVMLTIYIAVSR